MDNNKNLLTEVLNLLEKNNRTIDDVNDVFVVGKYNIGKDKFFELAKSANYRETRDEINSDLIIKGNDFILHVAYFKSKSYFKFLDLKIPKKGNEKPVLFTWFDGKHSWN